eukprot:3077194-Prymnesium_polylepis.1
MELADTPPATEQLHECDACGLRFPSEMHLLKHRAKFCSALVPLWANRLAEASRGLLDPADLAGYLGGGKRPSGTGDDLDKLSVGELRERTVRDQARLAEQKAEAEAARERAAKRMAAQRLQLELQERDAQRRLEAQRVAELEARVQRRAAERALSMAELQVQARTKRDELQELEGQATELSERRVRMLRESDEVAEQLTELRGGGDGTDAAVRQLQLSRQLTEGTQGGPQLSREAAARAAELAAQQAAQVRALQQEQSRLAARRQLLEESQEGAPTDADGATGAGALQRRLDQDARRLRELRFELGTPPPDEGGPSPAPSAPARTALAGRRSGTPPAGPGGAAGL